MTKNRSKRGRWRGKTKGKNIKPVLKERKTELDLLWFGPEEIEKEFKENLKKEFLVL